MEKKDEQVKKQKKNHWIWKTVNYDNSKKKKYMFENKPMGFKNNNTNPVFFHMNREMKDLIFHSNIHLKI